MIEMARRLKLASAGDQRRVLCRPARNAKLPMCSPAFAITCGWKTPADCLLDNSERYLKPPAAMSQLFADLPEAIAQHDRTFFAA